MRIWVDVRAVPTSETQNCALSQRSFVRVREKNIISLNSGLFTFVLLLYSYYFSSYNLKFLSRGSLNNDCLFSKNTFNKHYYLNVINSETQFKCDTWRELYMHSPVFSRPTLSSPNCNETSYCKTLRAQHRVETFFNYQTKDDLLLKVVWVCSEKYCILYTTYNVQSLVLLYSNTSKIRSKREVSTRELELWMDCGNEKSWKVENWAKPESCCLFSQLRILTN